MVRRWGCGRGNSYTNSNTFIFSTHTHTHTHVHVNCQIRMGWLNCNGVSIAVEEVGFCKHCIWCNDSNLAMPMSTRLVTAHLVLTSGRFQWRSRSLSLA